MSILDKKAQELSELRQQELGALELQIATSYTLADAIREGSQVTEQACGWGNISETACAMTAAVTAARSRGQM